MKSKEYEKDYEDTVAAYEALAHKQDQIATEMAALIERMRALETLIGGAYPNKGRIVLDKSTTAASARVNVVQPRVTEAVKGVLMASREALTSGEIHEKLRLSGWDLAPKSNPWALIHGICRRLVDQQFAREVDKDGRKAWIRAK